MAPFPDLLDILRPAAHPLETMLRGTLIYLALWLLLRFMRREQSGPSIADILFIILIADACEQAMTGEGTGIADGLILVGTIAAWDRALDWLCFHVPRLRPLLAPPPVPLVLQGKLQPRNLRRVLITREELLSELRKNGCERIEDVARCMLEADGSISVVPRA